MRQSENEIDRAPPRTSVKALAPLDKNVQIRQNQSKYQPKSEPDGKLYILTPIPKTKTNTPPPKDDDVPVYLSKSKTKSKPKPPKSEPPSVPKPAPYNGRTSAVVPVRAANYPQALNNSRGIINARDVKNTNIAQSSQEPQKKLPTVKRLAYKFKKNGLGVIDSYFNACFFYCEWKSEKKGRKTKDYLSTIAKHPRGWGKKTNGAVYKKNAYDNYMSLMTGAAKVAGAAASVFAPVGKFFRSAGKFFANFKSPVKTLKTIGHITKKTFGTLVPIAAIIFTVMTISDIYSLSPQLEFTLNGQNIGYVTSKETVGNAISSLENKVSSILNEPYEFTGDISYRIVLKNTKAYYVSEDEIYEIMYNSSQNAVTSAYGLYIDGELVGAAENESDINQVLQEVLDEMADKPDVESVEFANDIQIIEDNYAVRDVVTQGELKNIITYSPDNPENIPDAPENGTLSALSSAGETRPLYEYTIADYEIPMSDESFSEGETNDATAYVDADDLAVMAVASSLGLTPEAVTAIPRGLLDSAAKLDENNIKSGILSLISKSSASLGATSALMFKQVKTESYNVTVPYDVRYVESSNYYVGTQIVQSNGVNGENKITADVTYIGDEEVAREIKEVEAVKAPISKVVVRGTKPKPLPGPTGGFIRPVRGGYTTSRFGKGHRGLDLVVPYGTPIYASDGGTVIYAGFSGSYGNHVKLRHNDGFVTIYAHMSSIGVSNNEKVFQGQEIGKVGSTGNSSGNHLHFEILKNGVLVNPESYIK